MMVSVTDNHRNEYGIEPTCETLPIVSSAYHASEARQTDPHLRLDRAKPSFTFAASGTPTSRSTDHNALTETVIGV